LDGWITLARGFCCEKRLLAAAADESRQNERPICYVGRNFLQVVHPREKSLGLPRYTAVPMKLLVTGAAGFIGSATAQRLLDRGDEVVGLDNLNEYYDVTLKHARLARLQAQPAFRFVHADLADNKAVAALFAQEQFERVVHLGAQAGVRYSLKDPACSMYSRVAVITRSLIWSMRRPVPSTARARSCRIQYTNPRPILCPSTLRLKGRMS
jgi:hypothetical protein